MPPSRSCIRSLVARSFHRSHAAATFYVLPSRSRHERIDAAGIPVALIRRFALRARTDAMCALPRWLFRCSEFAPVSHVTRGLIPCPTAGYPGKLRVWEILMGSQKGRLPVRIFTPLDSCRGCALTGGASRGWEFLPSPGRRIVALPFPGCKGNFARKFCVGGEITGCVGAVRREKRPAWEPAGLLVDPNDRRSPLRLQFFDFLNHANHLLWDAISRSVSLSHIAH